jgi:hypothetical protein
MDQINQVIGNQESLTINNPFACNANILLIMSKYECGPVGYMLIIKRICGTDKYCSFFKLKYNI